MGLPERCVEDVLNSGTCTVRDVLLCGDLQLEVRNRLPSLIHYLNDPNNLRAIVAELVKAAPKADLPEAVAAEIRAVHQGFISVLQGSNTDVHRAFIRSKELTLMALRTLESDNQSAACTLLRLFPRAWRSWPDELEILFEFPEVMQLVIRYIDQPVVRQMLGEFVEEKHPHYRIFAWRMFQFLSKGFSVKCKPQEFFLLEDMDDMPALTEKLVEPALEALGRFFDGDEDWHASYRDFEEVICQWLGSQASLSGSQLRLAMKLQPSGAVALVAMKQKSTRAAVAYVTAAISLIAQDAACGLVEQLFSQRLSIQAHDLAAAVVGRWPELEDWLARLIQLRWGDEHEKENTRARRSLLLSLAAGLGKVAGHWNGEMRTAIEAWKTAAYPKEGRDRCPSVQLALPGRADYV